MGFGTRLVRLCRRCCGIGDRESKVTHGGQAVSSTAPSANEARLRGRYFSDVDRQELRRSIDRCRQHLAKRIEEGTLLDRSATYRFDVRDRIDS